MMPFTFGLKKLLLFLVPIILLRLLKRGRDKETKKPDLPFAKFDHSKVEEGEIIDES